MLDFGRGGTLPLSICLSICLYILGERYNVSPVGSTQVLKSKLAGFEKHFEHIKRVISLQTGVHVS